MQKALKKEIYYSKVMLFGEYSIIVGSMGLTIPYSNFNGELKFINNNSYTNLDFAKYSNQQLKELLQYIAILKKSNQLVIDFNTERLASDIHQGLYFESSIPEGYGLGSSGALVAALYNEYAVNRIEAGAGIQDDQLFLLKRSFAQVESFYHGTSSGIDPLICYLKNPIVLENAHHISSVGIPRKEIQKEDAIFLVNTGKPGKTGPLVKLFMDKLKNSNYKKLIIDTLTPLTNQSIKYLMDGQINLMFDNLHQLSAFQLKHFNEMIPVSIQSDWEYGLENKLYTLKLCGSGGGGFSLGFTRQYTQTKNYFSSQGKDIIPVYQEVLAL